VWFIFSGFEAACDLTESHLLFIFLTIHLSPEQKRTFNADYHLRDSYY